nr:hypothetical protein [Tanacetum cinerariifolium]
DKGNLHANVVWFREELDKLQSDLDNDPSNVSIQEKEAAAVVSFNEALLMEKKFLKQKGFLGQPGTTTNFIVNDLFPIKLNDNEALKMVRDISNQEVKSAMFSMGSDKSPGPNGFTAAFFKES